MSITKSDLKAAAAAAASEELPVLTTLKTLREGEFIDELNDAMQEAIDTATELGKPAKVTVTISITPAGRTVVIDDDINQKLPKAPREATIFFLGEGNALTRKDPKQTAFAPEAGFKGAAAVGQE
jgi:hypothetical protein